jgi:transglutaminase-like putative cysteine protease
MINDKLKPVLVLLVFGFIVLGALSFVSAVGDNNISDVGTSSTANQTTLSTTNTSEISTSNSLTSNNNNYTNSVEVGTNDSSSTSDANSNENYVSGENNVVTNNNTSTTTNTVKSTVKNSAVSSTNNGSSENVTIISANNTIKSDSNIISNNFTESQGAGKNFTVQIVDNNGNPIIGQHVSLNLTRVNSWSKIYWATTDLNGYAYLPINLAVGNYTILISYSGNDKYSASKNQTNSINIYNATSNATGKLDPIIIGKNSTFTYGEGKNFTIQLVDDNGNPIIGQHVSLNLTRLNSWSKIYWVTTDLNGYANLQINLSPGSYTIKSSYSGTNVYDAAADLINSLIVVAPGTTNTTNTTTNTTNSSGNKGDSNSNVTVPDGYVSLNDVISKSYEVLSFITTNHRLPNYVTINNQQYSMAQFAYLLTCAVNQINVGNTDNIQVLNVTQQNYNSSATLNGDLSINGVLSMASRINTYIVSNLVTPKYDSSNSIGTLDFNNYVYVLTQTLSYYYENQALPSSVSVNTSMFKTSSSGSTNSSTTNTSTNSTTSLNITTTTTGSGINDLNTISDTSAYLAATTNCEVNSAKIQALASSLTSGLSSTLDKALVIYNYVRDKITYSYYSNSKYGALGTLTKGYGNCVDQASLVIALCRAAGIPARYVHGKSCTFTSGLVTGHVWAQILVDGVWYCADPTSTRNSLGVIKNWNTKSFNLASISASISF